MSSDAYQKLYDNKSTAAWPSDSERADWARVVAFLEETRGRGGLVLDVGCYTGGLLARLGDKYEKFGIEVNSVAAECTATESAVKVWSSIEEVPEHLKFDVVLATDVMEHVPDPGVFLKKLAGLLRSDGYLILTTGDGENWLWKIVGARWWYCYYAEHIAFISERWIRRCAGNCGLDVVSVDRFHYLQWSSLRYLCEGALFLGFVASPSIYIRMVSTWKAFLGQSTQVSPKGCGLVADHLFIVMRKAS